MTAIKISYRKTWLKYYSCVWIIRTNFLIIEENGRISQAAVVSLSYKTILVTGIDNNYKHKVQMG